MFVAEQLLDLAGEGRLSTAVSIAEVFGGALSRAADRVAIGNHFVFNITHTNVLTRKREQYQFLFNVFTEYNFY